jgi:hypothetical protein
VTLIEQTGRALALAANQFARHSIVLDKLVHDIADGSRGTHARVADPPRGRLHLGMMGGFTSE